MRIDFVLIRVPTGELLFVVDAPRDAPVVVVGVRAAKRLLVPVLSAPNRGRVLRVVEAGEIELVGEIPRGHVEPELVLLDRSADRAVDVEQFLSRRGRTRPHTR